MFISSLDSRSGSIYESNPNSPQSPLSPLSPSSPAEPAVFPSTAPPKTASFGSQIQAAVTNALQGMMAPQQSYAGMWFTVDSIVSNELVSKHHPAPGA